TGAKGNAIPRNPPTCVQKGPPIVMSTKTPRTKRKEIIDKMIPICENEIRAGRLIMCSRIY
ncbi:MAG: hypothetical protein ACTSYJ_09435, partial [Candidatus Thorarchaeota archaeon]